MGAGGKSYIIVGAGAFGASTALALRRTDPSADVTLLDGGNQPNTFSASHDVNKIIRSDYGNVLYTKLALEAQDRWRSDPIYKPYYHQSGMLYAVGSGVGQMYIDNYKKLGVDYASEFLGPEEARTRFSGVFRDANWTDVTENYFNPRSGWGEATGALTSLINAAVHDGVKFRTVTVSRILFDGSRNCVGVSLENGEELHADNILLSVGAWTPLLLANSAPEDELLQSGDRMVAAAALQCTAKYPPEEAEKFKDAPVIVNTMPHTNGECIPPTKENRLKFNLEVTFTNKSYHEASKQTISSPPLPTAENAWGQAVPQSLKDEIAIVVKKTYGSWIKGLEIESYRMCWDAITPNQDFIITPHPLSMGLYIATGGSFHSWKFMPIIGEYVVKMMQGTLPDDMTSRWAWDRSNEGSALKEYLPKRDLKDIK